MRAYLYFTWGDVGDGSGFMKLKEAMLHEISGHIYPLGQIGFLFLTNKSHEHVTRSIRERKDRPFFLVDVTNGFNDQRFKTNIDVSSFLQSGNDLALDPILDKICQQGYASLSSDERGYLDAKSRE